MTVAREVELLVFDSVQRGRRPAEQQITPVVQAIADPITQRNMQN
jgi:hypothetical protein